MKILVPVKLVPDLVEELEINDAGNGLDTTFMRMMINELDDHAIEQGIILKEGAGAHVTVAAPDVEGADDVLFTAAAKGADGLVKLTGDFGERVNSHALARVFASLAKQVGAELILVGVQAHDNLDGAIGPILAEMLGFPYVGYVSGVEVSDAKCVVKKEYPGGLVAEIDVSTPAVLGIQAAENPPRYVAISKVRQASKTASIEEQGIDALDGTGAAVVTRMYLPEAAERATMLDGDETQVATNLIELFKEKGVL
jgi:electron transfer flavoprotein beta subunit